MAGQKKLVLCRDFAVTVVSATNLQDLHKVSKPKVYAKVCLGSDRKTEKRTRADKHGKLNPTWNKKMEYTIKEEDVLHYGLQLVIKFYFKRKLASDLYIGEIHWSIKDLFIEASRYNKGGSDQIYLPIKNGLSETGRVFFQYSFGSEAYWLKKSDYWKRVLGDGAYLLVKVVGAAIPLFF